MDILDKISKVEEGVPASKVVLMETEGMYVDDSPPWGFYIVNPTPDAESLVYKFKKGEISAEQVMATLRKSNISNLKDGMVGFSFSIDKDGHIRVLAEDIDEVTTSGAVGGFKDAPIGKSESSHKGKDDDDDEEEDDEEEDDEDEKKDNGKKKPFPPKKKSDDDDDDDDEEDDD